VSHDLQGLRPVIEKAFYLFSQAGYDHSKNHFKKDIQYGDREPGACKPGACKLGASGPVCTGGAHADQLEGWGIQYESC
jgi:hypothetical protein